MTLVAMAPIGLDACSWQFTALPPDAEFHELPGFGRRSRARNAYSMEDLADEVADSYAGELDVLGVSMGAMVAQQLAARYPERVRSMLTACTGAANEWTTMLARAQAVEVRGMARVLDSTLERWFTPAALARRPAHRGVAYARRTLLSIDPHSFADGWRAIAGRDLREPLRSVRAATTVIAGSADVASPVARTQEVAELVPNSRFVVLDGPHMMHLERGPAFAVAIREHLSWAATA